MIRFALLLAASIVAASPAAAAPRSIESIALPPSVQHGVEMVVIDEGAMPPEPELARREFDELADASWSGAPVDLTQPVHALYTELRRQLVRYQIEWSGLPQIQVPADGPALTVGSKDPRVPLLRERLGLPPEGAFDAALKAKVARYQRVHGLKEDGVAGAATLQSLNRGAAHYEKTILINMERARRLPPPGSMGRYILVDAGSARLWMYEDGKPVDSMRVIVGNAETQTPMMAALMRYVSLNPYWNVPPELARSLIAPRVLEQGLTYLIERDYEVLETWAEDAPRLDPARVDWRAVADNKLHPRLRRGPGPWNSMGKMKFMMPNDFGIYLHDVPDKAVFDAENRWISNGCVRLEDAARLARWIFGTTPKPRTGEPEERVDIADPMPVYITYLTVYPRSEVVFRNDPYGRDAPVMMRFADQLDRAGRSAHAAPAAVAVPQS